MSVFSNFKSAMKFIRNFVRFRACSHSTELQVAIMRLEHGTLWQPHSCCDCGVVYDT